jgi:predicted metal-dependent HD superfamily phosphohydrolase
MLKETFTTLLSDYTNNSVTIQTYWEEIEKQYTHHKRHYHTLTHLENLLQLLLAVKKYINKWNTTLFSLYYHDVIYNTLKTDNEEQSAKLAIKRMQALPVPENIIANCNTQILATKKHEQHTNDDINYFTDADLSILGQPWEAYTQYYQQVRKEYAIYPNVVYKPGRKKVLNHFLNMERIYKTEYFYDNFKQQAKENISTELKLYK